MHASVQPARSASDFETAVPQGRLQTAMTSKPPKIILTAAAAAFAVALPASASASAHKDCPPHKGAIASKNGGRVWHSGTSLYACTVVYGQKPHTVKLGPWSPKSRVAFDGITAAWTTPLTRDGVRSDRAWLATADGPGKRWIGGARLIPASASGPAREARIQRILLTDQGAAWVTRTGEVVLALADPAGSEPAKIGALPGELKADHQFLLVGSFTGVRASELAKTLTLKESSGDGDECGGVNPYLLTVQPDPAADPVGVSWDGYWTRLNCG